jgi:hypothetical protein
MPARSTLKAINEELARLGHKATLAKGGGYFYFQGPDADAWLDRTIRAATLSELSIERWVAEFVRLQKLNSEILGGAKPRKRKS